MKQFKDHNGNPIKVDRGIADAVSRNILDADLGVFLARELEYRIANVYQVEYSDIKFREFFPISRQIPVGAQSYTYKILDRVGSAKYFNSYSPSDIPSVDLNATEVTAQLARPSAKMSYSRDEVQAAQFANMPLDQTKANMVREAIERLMNKTCFFGSPENKLLGLFNNPNITHTTLVAGANGNTEFSSKTPDEIIQDFTSLTADVVHSTFMKERVHNILMPVAQYYHLANTRLGDGSDQTLLNFIIGTNPDINTIEPCNEMSATYNGDKDYMLLYDKNADKLKMEIAQETQFEPTQVEAFSFHNFASAKNGGLDILRPASVILVDGL